MSGPAPGARQFDVQVPVADLALAAAPGRARLSLGNLAGVHILVLLRHRH